MAPHFFLTPPSIIHVLATWLKVHFYDFLESPELETKLSEFIREHLSNNENKVAAAGAKLLMELIQNKVGEWVEEEGRKGREGGRKERRQEAGCKGRKGGRKGDH
jgi:hypothetical protein